MGLDFWDYLVDAAHPNILPFDGADGTRYLIKRARTFNVQGPDPNGGVVGGGLLEGAKELLEREAAVLQDLAPLAGSVVPVLHATPWLYAGGLQVAPLPACLALAACLPLLPSLLLLPASPCCLPPLAACLPLLPAFPFLLFGSGSHIGHNIQGIEQSCRNTTHCSQHCRPRGQVASHTAGTMSQASSVPWRR